MLPVQITMRDMPVTPTLENQIRKRADKLKQFFNRIMSCRVVIEFAQKHKHTGKLYNVRLDVTVPKKELVVTRVYDEDLYIAVRQAFDVMDRRLEEHARKRNGHIKTHDNLMHGIIKRLIAKEGYGFIEGMDGNEYYFSVTNISYPDFAHLTVGDAVEYVPVHFRDGRQAHHVVVKERNHHPA